jgi:type II secretory ATPase GspE/PulE/Tfp pilus assembly ATPase PilB-like protein
MRLRFGQGGIALCLLLASSLSALSAEIQLRDGRTYSDVTILQRDTENIQIKMPYGDVRIPLASVKSIDGVPVSLPTAPRPLLPGADIRAATGTALHPLTASPGPDVHVTTGTSSTALHPLPAIVQAKRDEHNFKMDLFLLVFGVLAAVWTSMLLWVQRDAAALFHGSSKEIERWNAIVLLLPGFGLWWYLHSRSRKIAQQEALGKSVSAPLATNAPPVPTAPRKRGLFGGRVKLSKVFLPKKHQVEFEFLDDDGNPIDVRRDLPETTGIEAAHEVLQQAITERASDVHIEPMEKEFRVRFRIDGQLQERMVFAKADGQRVISSLKVLAQIDVAEKRKAQDGRFRVHTSLHDIDFRVATASAMYGEKLVVRILDRKSGLLSLNDLGMPKRMLETFDQVIRSRSGIILATGPTGSGKTSTLYAALSRLDTRRFNVMTIEDPVEYQLDGATQIPVKPKAGVTFESGLRSILRQDPDVILVGEIRDPETATTAIRAALTGQLVFSTLHAQDTLNTIVRLQEMGVEKYQISSALLMVVAQRLVRVLCRQCREPYSANGTELQPLGLELPRGQQIYRAKGCGACDRMGYQGRTAIFELLVVDDELRRAIGDGLGQQALAEIVRPKGWRSYRDEGVTKIINGVTTVDEVLQAG